MQHWEYRTESLPLKSQDAHDILANLGQFGWELVSVDSGIAYFKRSRSVDDAKIEREFDLMFERAFIGSGTA